MTLLHEAVDAKKFDVRVVERNVHRGNLKAEDQQKAVNQLPDDGENAEWINVEQLAADDSQS